MAHIQIELIKALETIQRKLKNNQPLSPEEMETLLLGALIEEEA